MLPPMCVYICVYKFFECVNHTAPHHTAPQFSGVVCAVFILRGAVAVYEFSQTVCAGWFAVLKNNCTARTANTPNNN